MALFGTNGRHVNNVVVFFGSDGTAFPGVLEAFDEALVGVYIEFLLGISALIFPAVGHAENIDQAGFVYLPVDDFGGNADVAEQAGQFAGSVIKILFRAQDKLVECDDAIGWNGAKMGAFLCSGLLRLSGGTAFLVAVVAIVWLVQILW